jgi:hypothetical protein
MHFGTLENKVRHEYLVLGNFMNFPTCVIFTDILA